MYRIRPRHLFVMAHALTDPHAAARLDRLLAGLGRRRPELVTITPEELPEVITRCGWIGEVRQGAYHEPRDPDLLFTAFRWLTPEQRGELTRSELFARCHAAHTRYGDCGQNFTAGRIQAMLGAAPFFHFERREQWQRDLICWSLHDIHTAWGCLHRCAYCQRGSVYVINLNVEEFGAQVDRLLTDNPWQKTIRYDVEQDVLAIEPEYGACELLVNQFARYDDRYLMLFTKSANVGHLLRLEHRGHTIMLWTLTPRSVSRRYEARTGSMDERLAAARRCQEAGYPIRFKCKPIIPTRGWRAEMTEMLEAMYAQVQPENLSAEVVFFDSVAEMDATLGLDQLDPEFVEAARVAEAAPWSNDLHGPRPFPFEVKRVIYEHLIAESKRLSPATPVTLCAETLRMWQALGDQLTGQPWNYPCNCGPHCIPGRRLIEQVDGPDAARIAAAAALGTVPLAAPAG